MDRTESRKACRQRSRKRRHDLLGNMDEETRNTFIQDEKETKLVVSAAWTCAYEKGLRVVVDLKYDTIMSEKEMHSLAKQIKYCYATIRRMITPFAFHLVNCKDRIESQLQKIDYDKWGIRAYKEPLKDVFPAQEIVYLSPDATEVLTELHQTSVYVIGGIVDKSKLSFESLMTANSLNVKAMRLPIQEHAEDRTDHILNVNTVVEILAHFSMHGDWKTAILEHLPQRKQSKKSRSQKVQVVSDALKPTTDESH